LLKWIQVSSPIYLFASCTETRALSNLWSSSNRWRIHLKLAFWSERSHANSFDCILANCQNAGNSFLWKYEIILSLGTRDNDLAVA
jgi:phosphatidylserine decarboxylase